MTLPLIPAYSRDETIFQRREAIQKQTRPSLSQWTNGDSAMSAFINALSRKARTLVIVNSFAGATLLFAMAAPHPVSSGALGSEWHCSTAAFVLTTCRQTPSHAEAPAGLLAQALLIFG
ncbi:MULTISPECIES: hypothetical protein [unclassified Bradyrhizobium]|uniref:hypothetical protein n=1 Tax=unclassified Bradyrhizobium TaxID=2631580 RepID=UPI001FF8A375|nr:MULTISPECIES: hypothetical protein [unclassified Bradyrhizobium]